jgi:hypothetical protein
MCACDQKEVRRERKAIVTEVYEVVFGEDGNKRSVSRADDVAAATRVL